MTEPVFLRNTQGLTLAEIADLTGARPPPARLLSHCIVDLAPLDRAGPNAVTFFDNTNQTKIARATCAGACFTTVALMKHLAPNVLAFVVPDPYRAFVAVARALFPHALRPSSLSEPGTAAGAHVHSSVRLESGVTVEPGAVIGSRAEIGSGTVIGATAVVGAEVRIGRDCSIGAGSMITDALIGDRVVIHTGCKIGQAGFAHVRHGSGYVKVPQVGRVIIQDDVEIGAGATIDRGTIRDTVIGEGSKIDNLVQVGHNVSIGRCCVVAAQSGLSSSSTLEDFVALGCGVGVSDHVTIGEGAQFAGASNVHADVPPGARWERDTGLTDKVVFP